MSSPDTGPPPGRREFLSGQALASSVAAAFARARVYRPEASPGQARALRAWLKGQLLGLEPAYRTGSVSDDDHMARIISLARAASDTHSSALVDGKMRLGVAQKTLNLYLKYLWCLGWIAEPPHCPFDAVVISHLPAEVRIPWTRMSTEVEYRRLVDAARQAAGQRSLAEWELGLWNAGAGSL